MRHALPAPTERRRDERPAECREYQQPETNGQSRARAQTDTYQNDGDDARKRCNRARDKIDLDCLGGRPPLPWDE